jgi:hypothetical protein
MNMEKPNIRMVGWMCLAVLLLSACSSKQVGTATPTLTITPDPLAEEDRVYAALIDSLYPNGMLVIMDQTQTDVIGLASAETYKLIEGSLAHLSAETLADFKARNESSHPLRANMQLGVTYLLFTQKDRQELFRVNQSGWDVFYNRYPDAPGIMTLSQVGFNSKMDQALVYLGIQSHWLAGSGNFFLFKKVNGFWVIDQQVMTWIS